MFRHKGKGRTYTHNLKLASILSCVAGIVNITSVLELNTLTTNVTGHFAYFSEELILKDYRNAWAYMYYILFFLFGAFISGLLMEWGVKHKQQVSYILPISIEIGILLAVSFSVFLRGYSPFSYSIMMASALLFSMGLQNALVTRVSQSVVRTTHLTGIFTDLGIEISQLFFHKELEDRIKLHKSIYLKLAIVGSFFAGGIIGGVSFPYLALKTLLIPVGLLLFALWYDQLLVRYYTIKRMLRHHH